MKTQMQRLAACSLLAIGSAVIGAAAGPFALHTAAMRGAVDDARSILESGAAVNAVNDEGLTPLYYAIVPEPRSHDHSLRMTELLLRYGGDPNFTPESGMTPLDLAVLRASPGVVSLLLHHGGNANKVFPNGLTLLTVARTAGREEIAAILEDFGAIQGVSEYDRAMMDRLPEVRRFQLGLRKLREQFGSTRSDGYRRGAAHLASAIWPELTLDQAKAMVAGTFALIDPAATPAAARDERR